MSDLPDFTTIRVLYRDNNLTLWGIPYDMRPGQAPRDLQRAYADYEWISIAVTCAAPSPVDRRKESR